MSRAPLALTLPLALLLLAFAVPAAITAWRGARGLLRREGRLGLHTPAAAASDQAFVLANRVAAPLVGGAAAVAAVCAMLAITLPLGVVGAIVVAVLGLAGMFWQLASASRIGEQAARAVSRPARKPVGGGCCGGGGCGCGAPAGTGSAKTAETSPVATEIPDLVADGTTRLL